MQDLRREKETISLDGDNVATLEEAVRLLAMSIYDDVKLFSTGSPKAEGKYIERETLRMEISALNSISGALQVLKQNGIYSQNIDFSIDEEVKKIRKRVGESILSQRQKLKGE